MGSYGVSKGCRFVSKGQAIKALPPRGIRSGPVPSPLRGVPIDSECWRAHFEGTQRMNEWEFGGKIGIAGTALERSVGPPSLTERCGVQREQLQADWEWYVKQWNPGPKTAAVACRGPAKVDKTTALAPHVTIR